MVPANPSPPPPPWGGGGGGCTFRANLIYYLLIYLSAFSLFVYIVFSYFYFSYIVFLYFVYNGSAIKQKTRLEINPGGADINLDCIYLRGFRNCTLPDRAYTTEEVGTTRFASAFTS
jgi:hypothetical protein